MRYAIAVPVTALLIGALLSLAVQPPRAQNAQADTAGPVAEETRSGAGTTARSGPKEPSPEQDPQRVAG